MDGHGGTAAAVAGTGADRAVGALLGLACGDAVGTTLEFARPGTFAPIADMVGGGPFGLAPGQWTDDTSMALCLAESLVDTGGMDLDDQLRRYLHWYDHGHLSATGRCVDIGNATRAALERYRRTGEAVPATVDDDAAANGSLMRLAPVPVRWHADPGEAAARSAAASRPTHPAPRPVDACRLLGAMVAGLVGGASFDEVTADGFWRWGALHPEVAALAAGGWRGTEPPEVQGTGYRIDALEAALWAVGGADDFAAAVLRAANLGDDADTTAAIAGQLAGARWGASGIPTRWRATVTAGERITSLAQRLYQAGGGHLAEPPWPHDGLVHGWWVEPGRVLAGEYPGSPDPVKARHKLDVLIDAGMRTFVDLTTEADGLAPYAPLVEELAATRGLDLRRVRFPIPDLDVVADADYDVATRLVDEGRDRGGVYVHCWGGIGRTGTVIGCRLVDEGLTYDEVTARLDRLRAPTRKAARRAPETVGQHDLLRRRARA